MEVIGERCKCVSFQLYSGQEEKAAIKIIAYFQSLIFNLMNLVCLLTLSHRELSLLKTIYVNSILWISSDHYSTVIKGIILATIQLCGRFLSKSAEEKPSIYLKLSILHWEHKSLRETQQYPLAFIVSDTIIYNLKQNISWNN